MTDRSVVGPKGQITIPKELREKYHLQEGEEVVLVAQKDGVLLKHTPSALRGRLRGKLDLDGVDDEVRKLRSEWTLRGNEETLRG
jgi:AbrB family looped-hinge helix DNA binding protein